MTNKFTHEDDKTEFKLELNDKLEKEVVAFLNSPKGGDIYIGVADDGSVVGVKNVDKIQLAISDRIKNNILPTCLGFFDVFPEQIEDKTIIHIVISRGTEKPYYIKKFGLSPAGCYLRIGSGVQQMTPGMIDSMYSSRTRDSLRNIVSHNTGKLSFEQLKIYYQERGFSLNDSFLNNLDLYTPDEKLNYVAYLLADVNSISIKVAKYAGTDKCDLIENKEYGYCSLVKATLRVLDKLDVENKTFTKITGSAQRLQRDMINKTALREALINAIVHNDYTKEVPPVVEIYADRLSITSYGGLVQGLSKEEFFVGRSMPRNRELMRVFRDLKLVEQLGSGIHRILSVYNKDIFNISDNFLEICFPFEQDYLKTTERLPTINNDKQSDTIGKPSGNDSTADDYERLRTITDDYERLEEPEKQILLYLLRNKSITRKIAVELLKLQKTKVHEVLTGLLGENLIIKQGQGRSTYYTLVK